MSNESTVGELVVKRPSNARVFDRFGIDYCCGGKLPLSRACRDRGIDPKVVLEALAKNQDQADPADRDWSAATFTELTHHVETTHHAYLKNELPRLEQLSVRVAGRHGGAHPELHQLRDVFASFKAELESHMFKEERILFPLCRTLDQPQEAQAPARFGSVKGPVTVMVHEHDRAGEDLGQMRKLAGGYTPPADACNSYRALLSGLAELEDDMHRHVHLENNILFPRAMAAEQKQPPLGV